MNTMAPRLFPSNASVDARTWEEERWIQQKRRGTMVDVSFSPFASLDWRNASIAAWDDASDGVISF